MAGLPYMQLFVGDWLKDPCVQVLDYELQGIWFRLLCYMHESEEHGVLRMSDAQLAGLLKLTPSKTLAKVSKLLQTGVASRQQNTGYLMNRRMVREAAHYQQISEKRAEAGRKGGLAKAKQNSKQNVATSSSSSSSSSDSSSSSENKENTLSKEERASFSFYEEKKMPNQEPIKNGCGGLEGFAAFWDLYPKQEAQEDAKKAWRTLAPDSALRETIMAALARQTKLGKWKRDYGRWVPEPAKWLNGRRWEDQLPKPPVRSVAL